MRVVKLLRDGEIHVELLGDDGTPIPTVSPFLRHLRAAAVRPTPSLPTRTTSSASSGSWVPPGSLSATSRPPAPWTSSPTCATFPAGDRRRRRGVSPRPPSTATSPPCRRSTNI